MRRDKKALTFVLVAAVSLLGATLAIEASATTVGIRFTGTTGGGIIGTNSIDAAPGDVLTAIVGLTADAFGVSSYGVSVQYDIDLGDELDLLSATELLNAPFQFNSTVGCASTQESSAAQLGNVLNCEAATFGAGPPPPPTVDIIELMFLVTGNVATDGFDIETGFFSVGFDGMFDNAGSPSSVTFGTASVNVPEPSTALLIGLGIVGLATRSRMRSL